MTIFKYLSSRFASKRPEDPESLDVRPALAVRSAGLTFSPSGSECETAGSAQICASSSCHLS